MKLKHLLFSSIILLSGCFGSNNKEPNIKDIEPSIKNEIKHFCPYAEAKDFKKINGYIENDFRGNPEYIVEYEYILKIKASKDWENNFKEKNKYRNEAQKEIDELNKEVNQLLEKAKLIYDPGISKIYQEYEYGMRESKIKDLYLEIYDKFIYPSKKLIENFEKKWEKHFDRNEDIHKQVNNTLTDIDDMVIVPALIKPQIENIPVECFGLGKSKNTSLRHLNGEKISLLSMKKSNLTHVPHEEIESAAFYFIDGVEMKIQARSALRETENGWVLK